MSNRELDSLDNFERFVRSTIIAWSPEQRTALAVSMAERWLPVYEAFSEENQWGDPPTIEHAVQSVWKCVLGDKLTPKDRQRHQEQVDENMPDLEDFDGEEAVATCAMTGWALNCCGKPDNTHETVMAMVCGFEAVAHNIYQDTHWSEIEGRVQTIFEIPDETMESIRSRMVSTRDLQKRNQDVWNSPRVQDELDKQMKLLKLIGDMAQIDKPHIKVLREKLVSPELVGTLAPRRKPSRGLTNENIFEQYRRTIESDLKGKWHFEDNLHALGDNTGAILSEYLGEYMSRYVRRKDVIEQSPIVDVVGHRALLARYSGYDAAVQGDPEWDQDTRFWIEMIYKNPHIGLDVNSPEKPHCYGPSWRRLWIEARLRGDSDKDILKGLLEWARHQPRAWEEEDQRKKNGLAYAPELGERLTRKLSWRATDDVDHPWTTQVAGETCRVRLNDFPDDLMYTLIIDDAVIGKFHDWPESWQRQ